MHPALLYYTSYFFAYKGEEVHIMIYILKYEGYYMGEEVTCNTPFATLNEAVEKMRSEFEEMKKQFESHFDEDMHFSEYYDVAVDRSKQRWASFSEKRAFIKCWDDELCWEIQCDSRFSPSGKSLPKPVVVSWWSKDIQAVCNAIPDVRVFESMEAGKEFLFALYAERLADYGLVINGARDGSGNPIPGGYVSEDGCFASVWNAADDGPVTEVFAGSVQALALDA